MSGCRHIKARLPQDLGLLSASVLAMYTSVLVASTLVCLLLGVSSQSAYTQTPRASGAYQGGVGGYQGAGSPGAGGFQGGRGLAGDSRYGFNIVDSPDRYGYEANYPGGRASFYLLGPNRGPGQQRSRMNYM